MLNELKEFNQLKSNLQFYHENGLFAKPENNQPSSKINFTKRWRPEKTKLQINQLNSLSLSANQLSKYFTTLEDKMTEDQIIYSDSG